MIRRAVLVLLAVVLLGGCERPPPVHKETLYVFGTLVEVTLYDVDPETGAAAVAELEVLFRRLHRDWHAWEPGLLSDLNRAIARGEPFEVPADLAGLIRISKRYAEQSEGLFDPAVGSLVALWGFHSDDPEAGRRPDFDAIRALVATAPSMRDVTVEGTRVSSRNPAVQLDFGAVAKGLALDRAVANLKKRGIADAIVNAGGDLNVIGRPGDRHWKVAIRDPVTWGAVATIDAKDGEAVYTSGNYARFREIEGVRYAHIIDPRTGMPVDRIVSATVIHDSGATADAAATALAVAGPDDWPRIARRMGIDLALLIDAEGTVHATPAMAARVVFEGGVPANLVVAGGKGPS